MPLFNLAFLYSCFQLLSIFIYKLLYLTFMKSEAKRSCHRFNNN